MDKARIISASNTTVAVNNALPPPAIQYCEYAGSQLILQPKLSIGVVDDPLEHAADAVADKVMRSPQQNFIQRKCAHCEHEEEGGGVHRKSLSTFIQRKESSSANGVSDSVSSRINSGRGDGDRMDSTTKTFMESRFGADFSNITIHTNNEATQLNRDLNAKAFTIGNDIYFNEGQYEPESDSGKRLLAHELTHTLQSRQNIIDEPATIRRTCNLPFLYNQSTCQGSIHVGATTITPSIAGYYHLFILYTDNQGLRFYFRGGPGARGAGGYGNIEVQCAPYVEGATEYDTANLLEEVYQGPDACNKLRTLRTTLNQIQAWNIRYVPAGPNSNSVIATMLQAADLPLRKPAVPTPGFDMQITQTGTRALSQDRPTTLLLGVGGGSGLLFDAELQQRLYTFSPRLGGIPLPIPLILQAGAYGMPDEGRAGGSVGLGTDISLFNVPLPRHSPLGIQLGAGVTAGAAGIGDPTGANPEIGAYGRAGLYMDINRFRVGGAYQYNYSRDLDTGANRDMHSFLLQLGYTISN